MRPRGKLLSHDETNTPSGAGQKRQSGSMEARLWTFEDIKDATKRHECYRNSNDPIRLYFYGVALEMSGQSASSSEKYVAFRLEARRRFKDLGSAAAHYAREAEMLRSSGDERSAEHYVNMARILRGPDPGLVRSSKTCVVS
ncbi:unnamed protein product [Hapterophycus canaliculatus]